MGWTWRNDTGRLGEKLAADFLRSKGYSIIGKNVVTPFGEIDIVAGEYEKIVFFEVKTKQSAMFGPPLSAITPAKRKHILKNCQYYLKRYRLFNRPVRIDAIGIQLDAAGKLEVLEHVKNAIWME